MTINQIVFLKLLSESIFDNKKYLENFEGEIDWNIIYRESVSQAVVELIYESVRKLKISNMPDSELLMNWEEESMVSVMRNSNIMYFHKNLLDIMCNNNIQCCILKGAAAAVNYPNPNLRSMGDIDILVGEENFERAKILLLENGYVENDYGIPIEHELKFFKDGITIELHKQIPGIPIGNLGNKIREIVKSNIFETSHTAEIEGISFIKPSVEYNGLVLIFHIIHHISTGIGIRQFCDWALYVNNELTDIIWENKLKPLLIEFKILHLTKVVTKMCHLYLDLPLDKCMWCVEIDDTLCYRLMKNIFSDGNFGKKIRNRTTSAGMLINDDTQGDKDSGVVIRVFRNLQKAGKSAWPLARRNKVVSLFAWIYVPLRFIKRLFSGERTIKEFKIIIGSAKKRYPLLKKLRIFRE